MFQITSTLPLSIGYYKEGPKKTWLPPDADYEILHGDIGRALPEPELQKFGSRLCYKFILD
jgi:hypothetical protein